MADPDGVLRRLGRHPLHHLATQEMEVTLREAAQQALEALEQQRVFVIRPDHEGKEVTPANVTNAITALRAALAEPVQPVAWIWKDGTVTVDPDRADGTWTPLYTAPPQRKPLTDEEIGRICAPLGFAQLNPVEVARAIEAAHGIGDSNE